MTDKEEHEYPKSPAPPDDMTIITELIGILYQDMLKHKERFKVMELLRALEFKRKIAPPDDREGAFWNMIDEIRTQELERSATDTQDKGANHTKTSASHRIKKAETGQ